MFKSFSTAILGIVTEIAYTLTLFGLAILFIALFVR